MDKTHITIRLSPNEFKIAYDFLQEYKFKNFNQLGHKALVALITEKETAMKSDNIFLAKIFNFFKKNLEDTPENKIILDNFVRDFIPSIWREWEIRYNPNSKRITKYGSPFIFNPKVGRPKINKRHKPGKPKFSVT